MGADNIYTLIKIFNMWNGKEMKEYFAALKGRIDGHWSCPQAQEIQIYHRKNLKLIKKYSVVNDRWSNTHSRVNVLGIQLEPNSFCMTVTFTLGQLARTSAPYYVWSCDIDQLKHPEFLNYVKRMVK